MGKIVEALWDCPYCGAKGIGGLTKQCPACNHPQDEGTTFYLGEKKKYVEAEKAKDYGKGEDWTCGFCGSMNRYNAEECTNCGAPRDMKKGTYSDNRTRETTDGKTPKKKELSLEEQQKKSYEELSEDKQTSAKFMGVTPKTPKKGGKRKILIGALLAILAIIIFAMIPRKADTILDSKAWNRAIEVEEYKTVQESDWYVPDGGRVYKTAREIHHYDNVLDHYETVEVQKSRQVQDGYDTSVSYTNNGDGTYTENKTQTPRYRTEYYYEKEQQPVYVSVPRYQTKYYYDIDKWVPGRTVETSGTDDEPYWGELNLAQNEREGNHSEEYRMTFKNKKDKTYSCSTTEEIWSKYKVGDGAELTTVAGNVKKIDGVSIN